ncbi:MAG: hypothetical protein QM765_46050 [Myxococcales bacterium]
MVVDDALDASVAVSPEDLANRRYWRAVGVSGLCVAALVGVPALALVLRLRDHDPAFYALLAFWFASGVVGTFCAGWSFFATQSRVKSVASVLLSGVTGVPTAVVAYLLGQGLMH